MRQEMVLAFDPAERSWVKDVGNPSSAQIPALSGTLFIDEATLTSFSEDFGHLRRCKPIAVLEPGSTEDLIQMVNFGREHGIKIGPRGSGHNTFGQSLVDGGIVVRMSALYEPPIFGEDWVEVSAGLTWRQVLATTVERGFRPPVLTHNLGLSVGGTLAVGGIDGGSYRYGAQVDNVLELKVITGEGRLETCSEAQIPELFNALLAGQGQCGMIVRAKLRLIPAPTHTLFFQLLYRDLPSMLAEERWLIEDERFDRVSAHILPSPLGGWQYFMQLGCNFNVPAQPNREALLQGLHHLRGFERVFAIPYFDCANRGAGHLTELTENGRINLPHPWFDTFIPDSAVDEFGAEVLAAIDPRELEGDFPIEFYPFHTALCARPLFRLPDEPIAFLLDVMSTYTNPLTAWKIVDRNRRFFERSRAMGSKHYSITAIPLTREDWLEHYNPFWEQFAQAKKRFDPDHILTPGPNIF
jgi:cytokinin dehydrogenase